MDDNMMHSRPATAYVWLFLFFSALLFSATHAQENGGEAPGIPSVYPSGYIVLQAPIGPNAAYCINGTAEAGSPPPNVEGTNGIRAAYSELAGTKTSCGDSTGGTCTKLWSPVAPNAGVINSHYHVTFPATVWLCGPADVKVPCNEEIANGINTIINECSSYLPGGPFQKQRSTQQAGGILTLEPPFQEMNLSVINDYDPGFAYGAGGGGA